MIAAERPWGQDLIELEHQIAQLELEAARLAAELDADIDWIRFNCHLTSSAAADRLNVGRQLARMPESVQALHSGEIGYAHLKVMARTAAAVGKVFDEKKLLKLARDNSPGKFHFKCLHYRHSVDAQGYARQQEELRESRGLKVSTAEDGCVLISGGLDPVGGAVVRNALEALAKPCGRDDVRTREQRMADALVELAESKTKVQLQVTSSVETLLGLLGAPGAEHEFSLPISSKTVERWACDCSLSRVLLQDSVASPTTTGWGPHKGRAERTLKGPRRKALNARDQHCQWPGCERPANWCDGHHLKAWIDGGSSDLENMTLLCGRHHRLVHEGGWQLIKTEDGNLMTIAPPTTFGRPRAPD